ncbi:hypothetical protein FALBO_14523 [Fusarium albosuccineum]|uniref:Uncharacterized protein n=1 Tax=Fusarium albosuccineum TaxID=1237068 RepID=A0A8H4PFJ1_9HYPO|nr:hypothetical protein FALBO_14523 [Fusarium albosuccineum]
MPEEATSNGPKRPPDTRRLMPLLWSKVGSYLGSTRKGAIDKLETQQTGWEREFKPVQAQVQAQAGAQPIIDPAGTGTGTWDLLAWFGTEQHQHNAALFLLHSLLAHLSK